MNLFKKKAVDLPPIQLVASSSDAESSVSFEKTSVSFITSGTEWRGKSFRSRGPLTIDGSRMLLEDGVFVAGFLKIIGGEYEFNVSGQIIDISGGTIIRARRVIAETLTLTKDVTLVTDELIVMNPHIQGATVEAKSTIFGERARTFVEDEIKRIISDDATITDPEAPPIV